MQVATAATFSAAWLEGLRMMLARFEQPDGGFSVMADNLDLWETFGKCTALLSIVAPAAIVGKWPLLQHHAQEPRHSCPLGASAVCCLGN